MKSMNTPRTRAEFERNFNLLHRSIVEGKFQVPMDYPLDSIRRVRFLPNGRIDFLSVDERARLNANMMANMSDGLFENEFKEYHEHQEPTDLGLKGEEDDPLTDGSPVPSDMVD